MFASHCFRYVAKLKMSWREGCGKKMPTYRNPEDSSLSLDQGSAGLGHAFWVSSHT
jgi:hypothetical protein